MRWNGAGVMSLADIPSLSSRGFPLCPDCGEEVAPGEDHGDCDLTALKSLASALSQGAPMPDRPMICEDGVDACDAVWTDCCETSRPSCETVVQFDAAGDPDVTVCRRGYGCDADVTGCPRCASTELVGYVLSNGYQPDADRTRCDVCRHEWGDGLPDSASVPFPDGYEDCPNCEVAGDRYGRSCSRCRGLGIVRRVLIG